MVKTEDEPDQAVSSNGVCVETENVKMEPNQALAGVCRETGPENEDKEPDVTVLKIEPEHALSGVCAETGPEAKVKEQDVTVLIASLLRGDDLGIDITTDDESEALCHEDTSRSFEPHQRKGREIECKPDNVYAMLCTRNQERSECMEMLYQLRAYKNQQLCSYKKHKERNFQNGLLSEFNRNGVMSFPWKLHLMLEESESYGFNDIVSWQGNHSFKVHNPNIFEKFFTNMYFNQTRYKSFQRQRK